MYIPARILTYVINRLMYILVLMFAIHVGTRAHVTHPDFNDTSMESRETTPQGYGTASSVPPWVPESGQTHSIGCRRHPDLMEYCTYDHVCLMVDDRDERFLVRFDDSTPHWRELESKGDTDFYLNHLWQHEVDDPLPFRSFFHVRNAHWDRFLSEHGGDIEWIDGHSYSGRFDGPKDFSNIYHWGVHLFPGFAARIQMLEDRLPFDEIQPAMNDFENCEKASVFDRVYLDFNGSVANDWMNQTLYLSLGEPKCTEYHWRDIFWPPKPKHQSQPFLCFKRLTIPGSSFNLMPGVTHAIRFRSMLQAKFNLEYKQEAVTFIKRSHSRVLRNEDEVISALRNTTGRPVEIVSFDHASFEEQVRQMARTGLLVSTHGSQLNNGMFMPRGSATIELAPHRYLMQQSYRVHNNAGMWYYQYEAPQDPECQKECIHESMKSTWSNQEHRCRQIDMYCEISVDVRELCKIAGTAASIVFGIPHMGHLGCKTL